MTRMPHPHAQALLNVKAKRGPYRTIRGGSQSPFTAHKQFQSRTDRNTPVTLDMLNILVTLRTDSFMA